MVCIDGYSAEHYKARNQIVIAMPQTIYTVSNTTSACLNRKIEFSESDLLLLLELVRYICETR